jgi:hypothetical protein
MTKNDPFTLWPHLQALSTVIPRFYQWFHSDISEDILDTLMMVGGAVMCTLKLMKAKGLLKPDSPIQDIALILAKLHGLDEIWPGGPGEDELAWCEAAITMAKQNGVKFESVPFGVEKMAGEIVSDDEEDDPEIDWYNFDWKTQFAAFKGLHGRWDTIGGTHYDLTKGKKKGKKGEF